MFISQRFFDFFQITTPRTGNVSGCGLGLITHEEGILEIRPSQAHSTKMKAMLKQGKLNARKLALYYEC